MFCVNLGCLIIGGQKKERLADKEENLARRLLGVDATEPVDLAKIDKKIAPIPTSSLNHLRPPARQDSEPIEVLPEYQFVLEAIKGGCTAIFVTGRAGAGSPHLSNFSQRILQIVRWWHRLHWQRSMFKDRQFIHSFFSTPPRTLNPDEAFDPKRQIVPVIECLGALIVDEVSMVTPDLIDCISNTLKQVRRDARPFGGVPANFVGDLLQLPPVMSDPIVAQYYSDSYRTPYLFSARYISSDKAAPH